VVVVLFSVASAGFSVVSNVIYYITETTNAEPFRHGHDRRRRAFPAFNAMVPVLSMSCGSRVTLSSASRRHPVVVVELSPDGVLFVASVVESVLVNVMKRK
jgi:hypothetical protein